MISAVVRKLKHTQYVSHCNSPRDKFSRVASCPLLIMDFNFVYELRSGLYCDAH